MPSTCEQGIMVTGRCLDRNVDRLFGLVADILAAPHFHNAQRLVTLIKMAYTDMSMRHRPMYTSF